MLRKGNIKKRGPFDYELKSRVARAEFLSWRCCSICPTSECYGDQKQEKQAGSAPPLAYRTAVSSIGPVTTIAELDQKPLAWRIARLREPESDAFKSLALW